MSLAAELVQLQQLFQAGSLSPGEFTEAKSATLRRWQAAEHTPAAAPSAISDQGFEEIHTGAHDAAYLTLRTLLTNIAAHPKEPRYRKLRLDNPRLQSDLFYDAGSMPFLNSVGFTLEQSGRDELMVLPPSADLARVQESIRCVEELQARDDAAAAAAIELSKLRRSLAMEVRRENWEKVKRSGEIEAFVEKEFLVDSVGDELFSSAESLATLRVVLGNILQNPSQQKFRTLRLGNKLVRKAVLHQRGALELLVPICGFVIADAAVVLPQTSDVDDVRHGLGVVDHVAQVVEQRRSEIATSVRDAAIAHIRAEKDAQKRAELQKVEQAVKPVATSSAKVFGESNRVSIRDALGHLMGADR